MKVTQVGPPEVLLLEPLVFGDQRGLVVSAEESIYSGEAEFLYGDL
jgi:dTDP-4-dehydrorhamnose 3,5-epimerase-like enzyme